MTSRPLVLLAGALALLGCQKAEQPAAAPAAKAPAKPAAQKIGVLLTSHGSHSPTWRQAQLDLENSVRRQLLADGRVAGVKTAFMEYTEPSIATQARAFDEEGITDLVIVPVFLTVSGHTFDDIPTILGQKTDPKSLALLKTEGIKRYTPKAKVHMRPALDFTDLLKKNILRRAKGLSKDPKDEGLVLIAYGDRTYDKEWTALMKEVGKHVNDELGIEAFSYGWCGHIAHYKSEPTTKAIEEVLKDKKRALVLPVLVATDEMFQVKIIGGGINKVAKNKERVAYRADSILPDENVRQWVLDTVKAQVDALRPNS